MANREGNNGNSEDFIFLGSKITADGDCNHEIQKCLLLGRKAMTNLDGILKNSDATLPTKVCLVKAMVFLVVMYGWESWTIKKAECERTDAFELVLKKILESPFYCKQIQPGNPKGNQSWKFTVRTIFIGRTDAETPILCPPDAKNWLSGKDLTWCWERLNAEGEEEDRAWNGWAAVTSQTLWTWVWASSRHW